MSDSIHKKKQKQKISGHKDGKVLYKLMNSMYIYDNDLVATGKSKVTLMLNKPAYVAICINKLIPLWLH